jgi:hypothetical protein
MNEHDFIENLKKKAKDQEKIIKNTPFPKIFMLVSFWLGNHPWKILIPLSILLTILFHLVLGRRYDEFVLKIFGKI